jgi:hypothetical protein
VFEGDGSSCVDCAGVPNGDAEEDCAGVCGGTSVLETFCEDTDGDGLGNPGSEIEGCLDEENITDGCELPPYNLLLTEDGSVLYNSPEACAYCTDPIYNTQTLCEANGNHNAGALWIIDTGSDEATCGELNGNWLDGNIFGFQFHVDGDIAVTGASGGDAGTAGFTISGGGNNNVLGFSFTGDFIPSGCGTLVNVSLDGDATGIKSPVKLNPNTLLLPPPLIVNPAVPASPPLAPVTAISPSTWN